MLLNSTTKNGFYEFGRIWWGVLEILRKPIEKYRKLFS